MNKPNMNDDMQRLEQKIDSFRELFEEKISNLGDGIHKINAVEKRVNIQENRWNCVLGGAAVVSIAIAIIVYSLPSLVGEMLQKAPCKTAIISIVNDEFFEALK